MLTSLKQSSKLTLHSHDTSTHAKAIQNAKKHFQKSTPMIAQGTQMITICKKKKP